MNTFFAPRFRLGWMLFAIGVISSLGAFVARWNYENSLQNVQLTVDYDDTRTLADAYQISHGELLKQLKKIGITSVGIYNQTLGTLSARGRLSVIPREQAEASYPDAPWSQFPPAYRYLVVAAAKDRELFAQVKTHLSDQAQATLPSRPIDLTKATPGKPTLPGIMISSSEQLRGDAQLGFDPAALKAIQKVGLVPTARVSNALSLNAARLRTLLDECKATGARVVIFSEDEVLGYDTLLPLASKEMRARGLLFGNVEFTKQRGWEEFATRSEGQVVRVHSVSQDEAAKVKTHLLVDRYARAIKERDVRVAYIRLIRQYKGEIDPETGKTLTPLQQNLNFVASVSRDVKTSPAPFLRPPLRLTEARGFGNYPIANSGVVLRRLQLFAAGLGALGLSWLLLNLFFDLSVQSKTFVLFMGLIVCGSLAMSDGIGAKLIGLWAGVCAAPVAILWGGLTPLWSRIDETPLPNGYGGYEEVHVPTGKAFWQGCRVLAVTTFITLCGGLLIVAAFNHWRYLSHSDEFLGEKATLLFPPLLIALAFSGRVFPERVIVSGSMQARRLATERFQNFLSEAFTFRVAVVGLVLAVLAYLFVARAGNDSGMEISTLEWNFRAAMEQIFLTRPRTKEMFFGMPAMIFAVYFALKKQPLPALGATVAVAVGQADVLNTMCHFWTPLFYSLLRTFHAVWLGALLGGLALWAWVYFERTFFGRMRPVKLNPKPAPATGAISAESNPVFAGAIYESGNGTEKPVAQKRGVEPRARR